MNNVWSFLTPLFKNIDCANATATKDSDVIQIKEFIQKELHGFDAVNSLVADGLRKWYQDSVLECVKEFPVMNKGTLRHAKLLYNAGKFCFSQNMLKDADLLWSQ